jgi:hypothetical protein
VVLTSGWVKRADSVGTRVDGEPDTDDPRYALLTELAGADLGLHRLYSLASRCQIL